MKRTERKQLKENELATGLSRFVKWVREHEKQFMALALSLVAILIVVVLVRLVIDYQKSREARYLSEVLTLRAELGQKPENLTRLESLAKKTRYGRIASLALATYYMERNNLEKAEELLLQVKDKGRDLVHYQILDLYAQLQVKRGSYDRAVEIYQQIAKEKPKVYPLDVVKFRLADSLEKKGDLNQAAEVYRQLQNEYQNTYYGYQAALKAMQLDSSRRIE